MTVGDGDKPTDEYQRGFTAGYQRRVREELESWKAVIEGGQLVAFGEIIRATPFAEREQERLATVKAAHDAGVHGHSARGCPWCSGEGYPLTGDPAPVPGDPIPGAINEAWAEWRRGAVATPAEGNSYLPSGKPHSGDYGVPRGGDFACPGRAAAGPSSRPVCGMPDWDHDAHMYGPGSTVIPHYGVAPDGTGSECDKADSCVSDPECPFFDDSEACRGGASSRDWGAVDHLVRASRAFRKQHPADGA